MTNSSAEEVAEVARRHAVELISTSLIAVDDGVRAPLDAICDDAERFLAGASADVQRQFYRVAFRTLAFCLGQIIALMTEVGLDSHAGWATLAQQFDPPKGANQ